MARLARWTVGTFCLVTPFVDAFHHVSSKLINREALALNHRRRFLSIDISPVAHPNRCQTSQLSSTVIPSNPCKDENAASFSETFIDDTDTDSLLTAAEFAAQEIEKEEAELLEAAVDADLLEPSALLPDLKRETAVRRMRRRKVKIYNKKRTFFITILFGLWYTLSMAYNIFSKNALNLAPQLAWTQAFLQLSLGLSYVFTIWKSGYRDAPVLTFTEVRQLLPVALLHSLVHVGGVVSMGAGAVSFTYIVKASEPAVSAILSGLVTRAILPIPVYLTLIPVMGGVALSSVSELTFTWKSFNYAMLSNVASSSRGIVGKKTIAKRLGKNLTAINMYAVLTMLAAALILPVALALEGPILVMSIQALFQSGQGMKYFTQTVLAAMCYYGYNEVAFLCLDKVSPLSHAISNTVKRVFIIVSSMIVFGNKMTWRGVVGSVTAVLGVLLYSLTKQQYNQLQKSNKARAAVQR